MVDFLEVFLPICINILLIILLVIGIILGVRLINVIGKVDELVDNVQSKVNTFNGFFNAISFTTDKINSISDRIIEGITGLVNRVGKKKYSKEMEEDYE